MPRWCAEIYRYSIGNCGHLVVRQYMAVWTNATKKKNKRHPYFNRKLGLFVCFPALRMCIHLCSDPLWCKPVSKWCSRTPELLEFWTEISRVVGCCSRERPTKSELTQMSAWTKCKASAPNHVWDLGATETWGTRKSRDPCLVQFSKFGKNSVKVPPILCEAETTSTSTAVPHGLMVEFIARPAPPQTRNVWFDVCISENIEN